MTNTATSFGDRALRGAGRPEAPVRRVADWLGLAAAPTFAAMAFITAISGDGPLSALCVAHTGSALTGMVPMYVLMSVFHSAPWLKLILSR